MAEEREAKTWIMVADSYEARIFEAIGDSREWQLVSEYRHPESRAKGEDLMTGRPNREEPGLKPRDAEAIKFARELCDVLEKGMGTNRYDRLVLVAPPNFLGALRKNLSDPVAKRCTDSLNKELVHLKQRELTEHLQRQMLI